MRNFVAGIIAGIVILMAGAFGYFYFGFAPVATADKPMPMEHYLAKRALRIRINREAPKRDVSGFTPAELLDGANIYQSNCAFCHALPNQPKSAAAKGMFPDPPQLFSRRGMVTDDPAGVTYWKVSNGIRLTGMPGFHASLTEQQMWDVSALLARADKLPPDVMNALKPVSAAGDPPDPPQPASGATSAPPWKVARQISPAALAKRLAGPKSQRPTVIQVGFRVLYQGAHIPGAIYAGPASSAAGLERLKDAVAKMPHGKEIIIYCGCCPWEKCPNVHPGYDALRKMGFTNVVVLLLPRDFAHDWVGQGYPIAR